MLNFKVIVGFLLIAIAIALQIAGVHASGYYNYSNYAYEGYYGGNYGGNYGYDSYGYSPYGYAAYPNGGYSNYGYSNYSYPNYGYSNYPAYPSYNSYNPVRFQPVLPSNSNFYFAGTYTNPHSNFEWYAYIDPVVDFRYVPASVHSFFCGFSFC